MSESQSRLVAALEIMHQRADARAKANAEIWALEAEKVDAERAGAVFPEEKAHRLASLKVLHSVAGLLDADIH